MIATLKICTLTYGRSYVRVTRHEGLPIPLEFDFWNPEACAREILAMMSNASGGHTLRNCTLDYHAGRGMANISAAGAHVYYSGPERTEPMSQAEMEEFVLDMSRSTKIALGNVTTTQYGNAWKNPDWS